MKTLKFEVALNVEDETRPTILEELLRAAVKHMFYRDNPVITPISTLKYTPEVAERGIRHMLTRLDVAGWKLKEVHDGEERVKCSTIEEALEVIDSVEMSWVYVRREQDPKGETIVIIPNNDCDWLSDYSLGTKEFDAIMAAICAEIEE